MVRQVAVIHLFLSVVMLMLVFALQEDMVQVDVRLTDVVVMYVTHILVVKGEI